jgi:hypothetical protein
MVGRQQISIIDHWRWPAPVVIFDGKTRRLLCLRLQPRKRSNLTKVTDDLHGRIGVHLSWLGEFPLWANRSEDSHLAQASVVIILLEALVIRSFIGGNAMHAMWELADPLGGP